jgi:death on curing protein
VREPVWLSVDEVIKTDKDVVAETGEPFHVRDYNALASAVASPRHRFLYERDDIVSLALTLAFGIAGNQYFVQGNKRTGFISAGQFLWRNGFQILFPNDKLLGRRIKAVVRKEKTREECDREIRPHIVPIE